MVSRSTRGSSRLDTGWLLACCVLSVVAIVLPERMREPIATGLRRTVLAPLVAVQQQAETVRATLTARSDELAVRGVSSARAIAAPALQAENDALRRLLGLAGRLRDGFVVAEAYHATGLVDDFSLTLGAGSAVGVRRFTPVVTAEGLVGMVESVDPNTSLAITWAHPDFRVSAMSEDESAVGIVQPHLVSGAERYLLELRGVPFRASLDSGTLVVSSGLGATYPRGIAIGTVISEIPTTEKWARTYLLKPSVFPSSLSAVLLLLPDRVAAGVATAWTNLAAADSSARSIVAASDSAARQAALDELRARRAALDAAADSARADSMLAPLGPAPGVQIPVARPRPLPTLPPDTLDHGVAPSPGRVP
jgi:rod shape-determining protein MreC